MREIKFRAWDKKNKKMEFNPIIEISGPDTEFVECDINYLLNDNENLVLMQYTGLRDKNGTEIYDGDLILSEFDTGVEKIPRKVMWHVSLTVCGWYAPYVRKQWYGSYSEINLRQVCCQCKVIGNIFENPEMS